MPQTVDLLHVEVLLLHHVFLVVMLLELLRETGREVHLLGLAQVVVSQTVQVHLVELLRLLRLHALVVLLIDCHSRHPVVLALWPALAECLPLVLLRAAQLALSVQWHAWADSAILGDAQHYLSALQAVLALLGLQLEITRALHVILLLYVIERYQVGRVEDELGAATIAQELPVVSLVAHHLRVVHRRGRRFNLLQLLHVQMITEVAR